MPNWQEEESGDSLVKSFTLTFAEGASKEGGVEAEVSSIAWNSNGSVVGVAFGSRHHSTWCSDHKGSVVCVCEYVRGVIETVDVRLFGVKYDM